MIWALYFVFFYFPDHIVIHQKKKKKKTPTSEAADILGQPSAWHRFTCHRLLQFQLQDNQYNKWLVTRLTVGTKQGKQRSKR